jgi:hypothetical protein
MSHRLAILALIAGSALLAGCGKTADLDRPQPLFGHPSDSNPQTETRQQAADRARADAARAVAIKDAPESIEELRDYDLPGRKKDGPPSTAPLDSPATPQSDAQSPTPQ